MIGRTAAAALALSVLVTGCSARSASSVSTGDPQALGLEGPWAQQFADAFARSESDSERAILADGVVTPVELEQAHDGVRGCLKDSGLTIEYYDRGGFGLGGSDGGEPPLGFEKSDALLRACEKRFDQTVTLMYEHTRRNPQNLDETTIEMACFKRHEVVPKSYSRADFEADRDAGTGPFVAMTGVARDCTDDPLGLWLDR